MRTSAILLILTLAVNAHAAEKPHIIVIYADDMGYGDCTVNNPRSKIPTPHIDRLAREGLRFTDAHSPSSTCTASRYGLLTGVNPARTGVTNMITGLGPVIHRDEVTIADLLKDQGYITRMVGKWHLGFELHGDGPRKTFDFSKPLTGGPLDCGFDSYFGLCKSIGPPYFYIRGRQPVAKPSETTPGTKKDLKANGKDARTAYPPGDIAPGFVPEACNAAFCEEAVKILKEHGASNENRPLFLYYAMLQPHTPWLPTKEFTGKSKAGSYGDYIVQLDHEVGRVLQALKESGLEEDTLVIFSSDNGAMWCVQDIEQFGHRANGIFSGTKGTAWEGGHRVPFIVRWPGKISASTVSGAVINHTDLFATLAELLDIETGNPTRQRGTTDENSNGSPPSLTRRVSFETPPDSYSFFSVLNDPGKEHRRPGMAVTPGSYRLGDWKLRFQRGGGSTDREMSEALLHDLSDDPAELKDLSNAHVEAKQKLIADYQQFVADRKLKPLAVQVAERKSAKKRPTKKTPKTRSSRGPVNLKDAKLSEEQQAQVAALNKEYGQRRVELQKQLDDLLTDDQKQARDAARKKAVAEGKGGVKLRAAMDDALKLTQAQQKKFDELRQAIGQLTREHRQKLQEIAQKSEKAKPESESRERVTEREMWVELRGERKAQSPHFSLPERDSGLPNVFIYGDSISIHYHGWVKKELEGKANVYRLPGNGGDLKKRLVPKVKALFKAMRDKRIENNWGWNFDVIHFNVGIHDLKPVKDIRGNERKHNNDPLEYEKNVREILDYFKDEESDARIIFATTTPCAPKGKVQQGAPELYNELALEVIEEYPNVMVNDLYTLSKPHPEWFRAPDDLHFKQEALEIQGKQVAKTILEALK